MHVITSRVLDEAGFELLNATDGVAAIELLNRAERVPALVITDMRMPRMGGAELGRWLAEKHPAFAEIAQEIGALLAIFDRPK